MFEDGLIADIEFHLRDVYDAQRQAGLNEEAAFRMAVTQVGTADSIATEYNKNRLVTLNRSSPLRPARFMPALVWNYIKIALRKIKRQKGYSFINITGLAIGMVCFILIFLYIQFERSFDNFHLDANRIFRVALAWHTSDTANYWATISTRAVRELKEKYPQVEKLARISNRGTQPVSYEEKLFYEDSCLYVDPEIFEILSITPVEGNPKTALSRPGTMLITQRMATKYFGDKNPIGNSILIGNDNLEIAGIIADPPENTHLKYNFIASLQTEDQSPDDNWGNIAYHTYIKLRPGIDWNTFETSISRMADPYTQNYFKEADKAHIYYLQPVQTIHLHSNIRREFEPPSQRGRNAQSHRSTSLATGYSIYG